MIRAASWFLTSFLVLFTAGAVCAAPARWHTATLVSVNDGFINPLLIYGFNPQPEPPAVFPSSTRVSPTQISKTIHGVSGAQFFQVLIGVGLKGQAATLSDPDLSDPLSMTEIAFDTGADTLSIRLTFQSSSGGIGLGAVSFNPQPEPPPLLGQFGLQAFEFQFTSLSDANVTLQVLDSRGTVLGLTRVAAPIPLPASVLFLITGLGGLTVLGRARIARPSRQT
ncbi:MAG: VPLPA-CTERM sorting domain-containing protein [Rhodobacteraceae bacterium]|nr:VPLPA-CTERM sorting domain-containing protein [Paracoccaceae bacterium]